MFNFDDFKFIHLSSVESTNDYAKSSILNNNSDFIVIADTQTKGKTTKSNAIWESPVGNLYFSMAVRIGKEHQQFTHLLSFLTALSLVESVKSISGPDVDIKIKWPNDVLLNVKKLSGILIEQEGDYSVIGIGVNINQHPVSGIKYPTTSLSDANIHTVPAEFAKILAKKIIQNLNFFMNNNFNSLVEKIKPYMYNINKTVYLSFNNQNFKGIFENIDSNGAIVIKTDSGVMSFLSAELTKENFV